MQSLFSCARIAILALVLAVALSLFCAVAPPGARAQSPPATLGSVTMVGVEAGPYSAKVRYQPVPGANDYALLILGSNTVKCAGLWHLDADGYTWPYCSLGFANTGAVQPGSPSPSFALTYNLSAPWPYIQTKTVTSATYQATPALWGEEHHADPPALEIEVNGLQKDVPVTAVVVALDALAPYPWLAGYTGNLSTAYVSRETPLPAGYSTAGSIDALGSHNGHMEADATGQIIVANGQNTNPLANPNVIAASAPFTLSGTGDPPVPSTASATGVLYDPLTNGTITKTTSNATAETVSWTITTPAASWLGSASGCDVNNTSPSFPPGDIFTDILTDGGAAGTGNPPHAGFSAFGLQSTIAESLANGAVLHIHVRIGTKRSDDRRYVSIGIFPAGDPIQRFDWQEGLSGTAGAPINNSQEFAFFELNGSNPSVVECAGGSSPAIQSVAGAAGQAKYTDSEPLWNYQLGRGDDDGSAFDVFCSQSWYAVFENGALVSSETWPTPLPFASCGATADDWAYHLILCQQDDQKNLPADTYDDTIFPGNSQRWIGDLGEEILPASYGGNEAACAALLSPETFTPPTPASAIANMPTTVCPLTTFFTALQTPPAPTVTIPASVTAQFAALGTNPTVAEWQAFVKAVEAVPVPTQEESAP
jgi:hypothetical protein